MRLSVAVSALVFLAAGCATNTPPAATVTVTAPPSTTSLAGPTLTPPPPLTPPPTTTQTTTPSNSYSQSGTYAVGATPSGGLQAAIPPGRYTVEYKPSDPNYPGAVFRCNSYLCGPTYVQNAIGSVMVMQGQLPLVVEIEPNDVAVYLSDVTLTPVG